MIQAPVRLTSDKEDAIGTITLTFANLESCVKPKRAQYFKITLNKFKNATFLCVRFSGKKDNYDGAFLSVDEEYYFSFLSLL